ncbi:MAG: hypothetical protein ABIH20_03630 [Candidatus Diapherotrites archaeon]
MNNKVGSNYSFMAPSGNRRRQIGILRRGEIGGLTKKQLLELQKNDSQHFSETWVDNARTNTFRVRDRRDNEKLLESLGKAKIVRYRQKEYAVLQEEGGLQIWEKRTPYGWKQISPKTKIFESISLAWRKANTSN